MGLNAPTRTSAAAGARPRLPGPDVVRAVALIGVVVMNYHGYLILRGGSRGADTTVGEAMIPIAEVTALNHNKTTTTAVALVRRLGYNRLPVFEEFPKSVFEKS